MNTASRSSGDGGGVMYCDKDSRGLYSIIGLTHDQLEVIHRALTSYRIEMVHRKPTPGSSSCIEYPEQYERAGAIVRRIGAAL